MVSIVLFTRDLRVHDHPALTAAAGTGEDLVPLFVLDPELLGRSANRARFLMESLVDLDRSLASCGSGLVLREGEATARTVELVRATGASSVHLTADVTGFAQRREAALRRGWASTGRPCTSTRATPSSSPVTWPRPESRCTRCSRPTTAPGRRCPGDRSSNPRRHSPSRPAWISGHDLIPRRRGPIRSISRRVEKARAAATSSPTLPVGPRGTRMPATTWRPTPRPACLPTFGSGASAPTSWRRPRPASRPSSCGSSLGATSTVSCWPTILRSSGVTIASRPPTCPRFPTTRTTSWSVGSKGEPVCPWSMPGCGNCVAKGGCTTGPAWSRLPSSPGDWGSPGRRARRTSPGGWWTAIQPTTSVDGSGWRAPGSDPRRARSFNPVRQAQRFDPDGAYVRRYVRELAAVDAPAIFAPWKDPQVLRSTGYPAPIVEVPAGKPPGPGAAPFRAGSPVHPGQAHLFDGASEVLS